MINEFDQATLIQARKRLVERDCELQASDFTSVVSLVHQDGSTFLFARAVFERVESWLLVWTEHTGYFKFHMDDLKHYRSWES